LNVAAKQLEAEFILGSGARGCGWQMATARLPVIYRFLDIWTMFRITLPVLMYMSL